MASSIARGLSITGRRALLRSNNLLQRHQDKVFPASKPFLVRAWFSSYPPHEVVGLPSLSPVCFSLLDFSDVVSSRRRNFVH